MSNDPRAELLPCAWCDKAPEIVDGWILCPKCPGSPSDSAEHWNPCQELIRKRLDERRPAPVEPAGDAGWDAWIKKNQYLARDVDARTEGDVVHVDDLRARLASLPSAEPSVPVAELTRIFERWAKLSISDKVDKNTQFGFEIAMQDLANVIREHEARARSGDGIPKA